MSAKNNILIENIECICVELAQTFCKKQGFQYDYNKTYRDDFYFIVEDYFGIINIGDYYFNMSDLLIDVRFNIPKGEILKWYDESLEMYQKSYKTINYNSYLMSKGYKMQYSDITK